MSIKTTCNNQKKAQVESVLIESNNNNEMKQEQLQTSNIESDKLLDRKNFNIQASKNIQCYHEYIDIMGFPIFVNIKKQKSSDEQLQQMYNQKQNETPKRTYITTPLKRLSTRSPLQDITPSISKKLKSSCFNHNKINTSKNFSSIQTSSNSNKSIFSHLKSLRI